jgi:hypothetical protein
MTQSHGSTRQRIAEIEARALHKLGQSAPSDGARSRQNLRLALALLAAMLGLFLFSVLYIGMFH